MQFMPTIQVEAHVSGRDLLRAVEQLDPVEFQQFVSEVLTLRARRQAPQLPAAEAQLLEQINRGLPEDLRRRMQHLRTLRQRQTLTPEEQTELLRLTDQVEQREADRAAALAELARLRGVPLADLMQSLGIRGPAHE
jgi:hypothetical protein